MRERDSIIKERSTYVQRMLFTLFEVNVFELPSQFHAWYTISPDFAGLADSSAE
jgi:hypothetical protein